MPDPFYGTTCRRIHTRYGVCEIIWALPHKEGLDNYAPGKMFHNEFVWECIQKKKTGALERMMEEYNKKLEEKGK